MVACAENCTPHLVVLLESTASREGTSAPRSSRSIVAGVWLHFNDSIAVLCAQMTSFMWGRSFVPSYLVEETDVNSELHTDLSFMLQVSEGKQLHTRGVSDLETKCPYPDERGEGCTKHENIQLLWTHCETK